MVETWDMEERPNWFVCGSGYAAERGRALRLATDFLSTSRA